MESHVKHNVDNMINKDFEPILNRIRKFRDDRDWLQFHNPKDMAAALSIESGELLELFLWKNEKEINEMLNTTEGKTEVSDEIADILHYLLQLADNLKIDLENASKNKLEKSSIKYPIEKAKGNAKKYTKLL
jgi:NTP pyrophosphatase (non-canonical NTP hydrolase)